MEKNKSKAVNVYVEGNVTTKRVSLSLCVPIIFLNLEPFIFKRKTTKKNSPPIAMGSNQGANLGI